MMVRMMFLLRMLMKKGRGGSMDPLQVSMTGVRMGERFLQIGCSDKALLAGLAAKVGLSGSAAVVVKNGSERALAESIGRKVGALIDVSEIDVRREWPIAPSAYDMIVVDDTASEFRGDELVKAALRNAFGSVRPGGRIEVVTRINTPHEQVDFVERLSEAGFKPVRILADRKDLRFVEGLRPNS
jgi:hypothetical protein